MRNRIRSCGAIGVLAAIGVLLCAACVVLALRVSGYNAAQASIAPDHSGAAAPISAFQHRFVRDPDALLGVSADDIRHVLHDPEMVRQDLPTVVWQYRSAACVLDLYFTSAFADIAEAPVMHYEVRTRDAKGVAEVADQDCLRDLVRSHNVVSFLDISAFYKSAVR
ncbi:MAG: hypothetical protein ACPGRX_02825 [Bdellovibrionales bacterium]